MAEPLFKPNELTQRAACHGRLGVAREGLTIKCLLPKQSLAELGSTVLQEEEMFHAKKPEQVTVAYHGSITWVSWHTLRSSPCQRLARTLQEREKKKNMV